jgi:predicted alpha/beta-hydrolase family hydrolase
MEEQELSFLSGDVVLPALLVRPPAAHALLVLGHGAGAGMRHVFMEALARVLHDRGIATLRYPFRYLHGGRKRIDPPAVLEQTVRDAVACAAAAAPDLPRFGGGKSMGGRMSSRAAADGAGLDVRGLVFFGFPLHPARQPGVERAVHLARVPQPMLFLQGTRDDLADLSLLREVVAPLPAATLHVVEHADHGFAVLKRSGRTNDQVLEELADTASAWIRERLRGE